MYRAVPVLRHLVVEQAYRNRSPGHIERGRVVADQRTADVDAGLLQQVVSTGQRVPEDLAIVGYDDIAFAAGAAVPLTSVRQPRQSLGRAAAELLIDEVNNPDHQHRQVEFTPELIARTSTLG